MARSRKIADDLEGHGADLNLNEPPVADEDVEGHGKDLNVNETGVAKAPQIGVDAHGPGEG